MLRFKSLCFALVLGLVLGLAAGSYAKAAIIDVYRSVDGSGNNLTNSDWGAAGTQLIRSAPAQYGDGISTPSGSNRAGARVISNAVSAEPLNVVQEPTGVSNFFWAWGQFIDHDITLVHTGSTSFDIAIPTGDPYFDPAGAGTRTMGFTRSKISTGTGTGSVPAAHDNEITAWIDGSNVYGSDAATAAALRTNDGTGQLKLGPDGLLPTDAHGFFQAGDIRVNEQPALTSLHTVFAREHNRIAEDLRAADPSLSGEELYQQARLKVGAEIQAITYNEWLPALVGESKIGAYQGYDASVNPQISEEFSASTFRFGHSMLPADLARLQENGDLAPSGALALKDAFFNPAILKQSGTLEEILRGLGGTTSARLDPYTADAVRNFLNLDTGRPILFDLAALNIQRGRDHGIADYNTLREAYGLAPVTRFSDISTREGMAAALASVYGDINDMDSWVAGLSEDPLWMTEGSSAGLVGALMNAIFTDQFTRLRAADRFWYENIYSGTDLQFFAGLSLADVLTWNTDISWFQNNVFYTVDRKTALNDAPEPATLALVLAGLVMLGHLRLRRRQPQAVHCPS